MVKFSILTPNAPGQKQGRIATARCKVLAPDFCIWMLGHLPPRIVTLNESERERFR
jgi:hypothetical protein